MSTLYFVLKNTVITFVLVSLLQIRMGSYTFEQRLMKLVRSDLAPLFLSEDSNYFKDQQVTVTKEQIQNLKKKIGDSDMLKNAKSGAKDLILDEIQSLFEHGDKKNSEKDSENE